MKKKILTFDESPDGIQLHAGRYVNKLGEETYAYHSDNHKTYWTGYMPHGITPEELFTLAWTTILDLQKNHPDLNIQITKK